MSPSGYSYGWLYALERWFDDKPAWIGDTLRVLALGGIALLVGGAVVRAVW